MTLRSYERKVLRLIFGSVNVGMDWRIRGEFGAERIAPKSDISMYPKIGTLRWGVGHVERMNKNDVEDS